MKKYILESLSRQTKGLLLLAELLDEELLLLQEDAPQAVSGLEFSIQELLRQITLEKVWVVSSLETLSLGAKRLDDVIDLFDRDEQARLAELKAAIDNNQQQCARKAAINADIAQALGFQSKQLLSFFREQIMPRVQHTYSSHGRWASRNQTATLIQGSL